MDYKYTYEYGGSKKAKVTLTVAAGVLKNLDKIAADIKIRSRSELVENILSQWLDLQAKKNLVRDTRAYYQSLPPQEKQENEKWSKNAARAARNLWEEP
ncbi:MAG: hypothetical protein HY401_02220 [Elusimicrobia bacterium]|nr:hypothetical protein [Elusimicrobiota bacterium]